MELTNYAIITSAEGIFKPTRTKAVGISVLLLGLFLLFFARSPFQPSLEDHELYEEKANNAMLRDAKRRNTIDEELDEVKSKLNYELVWFWRFRSPYKDTAPPLLRERDRLERELRKLDGETRQAMAEAKSHIGLWSNQGIEESRDVLWRAFRQGNEIAKRHNLWDSIYIVLTEKNDNALFTVARLIATVVLNYSIAFFVSLISFAFQVWWVIGSFQPNLVSAVAFYLVAIFCALSFFTLIIGGIYAAGAGSMLVITRQALNRRLEVRKFRRTCCKRIIDDSMSTNILNEQYQRQHERIRTRSHYE